MFHSDKPVGDPFVCPQCSVHLCTNVDSESALCVVCGEPSKRNGPHDMGSDMICCDRDNGGLFHQSCVRIPEGGFEGSLNWFCIACDGLKDNGFEGIELEEFEAANLSENSVAGVELAIKEAFNKMPLDKIIRGWETWQETLRKIVAGGGGNQYNMHHRESAKKQCK